MFRVVFLLSATVTLGFVLGASVDVPARSNGTVAELVLDAEDLSANFTRAPLAAEKQILDKEVCAEAYKGLIALKNGTLPVTLGEKGLKKVVITETKVEEFPKNGTKEVTVTKTVEKLPSNETREQTEIERKTIKDAENDTAHPKKNIAIEKEVENTLCKNTTTEAMKPTAKTKEQEKKMQKIKEDIKDLRRETEKVKEELNEEIKEKEKEKGELKKEMKAIEEINEELKEEIKETENEELEEAIMETEKVKEDFKGKIKETEKVDEDLKEKKKKTEKIEEELKEDIKKLEKLEKGLKEKINKTENLKEDLKEEINKTVMAKEELKVVKNRGNNSCVTETEIKMVNAEVPAVIPIEKKSVINPPVKTAAKLISLANTEEKIFEKVLPEMKANATVVEKLEPVSKKEEKAIMKKVLPTEKTNAQIVDEVVMKKNGTKVEKVVPEMKEEKNVVEKVSPAIAKMEIVIEKAPEKNDVIGVEKTEEASEE